MVEIVHECSGACLKHCVVPSGNDDFKFKTSEELRAECNILKASVNYNPDAKHDDSLCQTSDDYRKMFPEQAINGDEIVRAYSCGMKTVIVPAPVKSGKRILIAYVASRLPKEKHVFITSLNRKDIVEQKSGLEAKGMIVHTLSDRKQWVTKIQTGEDGPNTYEWEAGTAP